MSQNSPLMKLSVTSLILRLSHESRFVFHFSPPSPVSNQARELRENDDLLSRNSTNINNRRCLHTFPRHGRICRDEVALPLCNNAEPFGVWCGEDAGRTFRRDFSKGECRQPMLTVFRTNLNEDAILATFGCRSGVVVVRQRYRARYFGQLRAFVKTRES
jgi:hypothetical protein